MRDSEGQGSLVFCSPGVAVSQNNCWFLILLLRFQLFSQGEWDAHLRQPLLPPHQGIFMSVSLFHIVPLLLLVVYMDIQLVGKYLTQPGPY